METIRNFSFFIKEAFISLKKGNIMTFAAITIITLVIFIVGVFFLLEKHLSDFTNTLRGKVKVDLYLAKGVTGQVISDFMDNLRKKKGVRDVKYISPDKALVDLKEKLKLESDLNDVLKDNPLPPTVEVELGRDVDISKFVSEMKENIWVEDISYAKDVFKRLNYISEFIKKLALIMIVVLVITAFLIVFNTIKITVAARQEEIEIMKLVGATNWFIRWPFIIEGFLQGILGSILACITLYFVYKYGAQKINTVIPFIAIKFNLISFAKLSAKLLSLGVIIGMGSSFLAVRRFLKV